MCLFQQFSTTNMFAHSSDTELCYGYCPGGANASLRQVGSTDYSESTWRSLSGVYVGPDLCTVPALE